MNPATICGNVLTLSEILRYTREKGYAVGAFSPRYTAMIRPILRAGQKLASPLIVQISQKELKKYNVDIYKFAQEFYTVILEENVRVPVTLHLDHTKDFDVIKQAIEANFTSVMIDASDKSLADNIAITKKVVEYAHERGVSVEAELGRIGTTDFVETNFDEQLYTDPQEAAIFVEETGVDALAVAVGTAHGPYVDRKPKIDYQRLFEIKVAVSVPLVLHGASGIPSEMIRKAISQGGVSKINFATDLEAALLAALGYTAPLTDEKIRELEVNELQKGAEAVERVVECKIAEFLGSQNHAFDFVII
ncbi:fructose-bisphosphate aldolase class II [Caldicoprobacter guelmensis]|uniref:class II fructose-bisphosphate aldolase n=1 Tax=Caldicoprobacter guelmensis TaxID=1170224 RepID=UPI001A9C89F6|nr:class II fructose-bisphosphate aldolase [Caldicoprobacter guelmensis]MBM7582947.1 fructose-bisphosphate aldolase class II [Caldicoprobacter guelmensis]